jgi:hypothetical protein
MPNVGNSKREIFAIGLDERHIPAIYQCRQFLESLAHMLSCLQIRGFLDVSLKVATSSPFHKILTSMFL